LVTGRGVDVFALFVLLFTAGLLCLATVGRTSVTGLIAIVTGSVIIGCTLLQSPGYVNPPALTDFGVFDIVLSFLIAAVALVHSLHLVALDLEFQRRMVWCGRGWSRVSARTGLRPAPGLSLRASQCGDHLVAGQRRELAVSRVRGQRVDREPSGLGDLGQMADVVDVESIRQPLVAEHITDDPMVGLVRGNGGERAQGPQPLPTQAEPELLLDLSDDGLLSGLARL